MSIQRNTAYNLLGSIIPLCVALITVPLYLDLIGESRYGVLAIAWLLLGYFGIFDLGLGRATAQRIAQLKDVAGPHQANTFWTALSLNTIIGCSGGLLIWPVAAYFFGDVLKMEAALRPEIQSAVPWLVLAVPIATLSGTLTGGLQGREKFLDLNIISTVSTVMFQAGPLMVAFFWKPDLGVLLPSALAIRLITLIVLFARCRHYILSGYPIQFDKRQARTLLAFGGWVTVSAFVGPMMVILDRFIIGALSGVKAVSYYTVPFQLAERSRIIPGALTSAIFPRFASNSTSNHSLAVKSVRVIASVITPLFVIGILFLPLFLELWISPTFSEKSALAGKILLIGFWVNCLATVPFTVMQAQGRPDLVAKIHLAELVPYFFLLYLGLHLWGIAGAAVAFSIRVAADFFLLSYIAGTGKQTCKLIIVPIVLLLSAFLIPEVRSFYWVFWVTVLISASIVISWILLPVSLRKTMMMMLGMAPTG